MCLSLVDFKVKGVQHEQKQPDFYSPIVGCYLCVLRYLPDI